MMYTSANHRSHRMRSLGPQGHGVMDSDASKAGGLVSNIRGAISGRRVVALVIGCKNCQLLPSSLGRTVFLITVIYQVLIPSWQFPPIMTPYRVDNLDKKNLASYTYIVVFFVI